MLAGKIKTHNGAFSDGETIRPVIVANRMWAAPLAALRITLTEDKIHQ